MLLNAANLTTLFTGFKASFQRAFDGAPTTWSRVAMLAPSTTLKEEYGWLGQFPRIREWVGDRVVNALAAHDYTIRNKDWELTVAVDRNDIEDDRYGIYAPMFDELGRVTAQHPDELVWGLLKAGFTTLCYDGQFFFDTDHPVLNAAGEPVSVSNSGGGSGTPWFLLDTTRAIKPLIYQRRKEFMFTRMDAPTDEVVFSRKEYRYGVDGRSNVGFGFWQLGYGSKQTLDQTNYEAARAAMLGMLGDYGRPLGIRPNRLVVPPALEGAGLELLNAERNAAGATNVWRGTAELLVVPWLA